MSMSMRVQAFKPADDKWRKMKEIWDSCEEAGVEVPREVSRFFGDEDPDPSGVDAGGCSGYDEEGDLPDWITKVNADMTDGFEIDTTKLPKDVTRVRFTCSY